MSTTPKHGDTVKVSSNAYITMPAGSVGRVVEVFPANDRRAALFDVVPNYPSNVGLYTFFTNEIEVLK